MMKRWLCKCAGAIYSTSILPRWTYVLCSVSLWNQPHVNFNLTVSTKSRLLSMTSLAFLPLAGRFDVFGRLMDLGDIWVGLITCKCYCFITCVSMYKVLQWDFYVRTLYVWYLDSTDDCYVLSSRWRQQAIMVFVLTLLVVVADQDKNLSITECTIAPGPLAPVLHTFFALTWCGITCQIWSLPPSSECQRSVATYMTSSAQLTISCLTCLAWQYRAAQGFGTTYPTELQSQPADDNGSTAGWGQVRDAGRSALCCKIGPDNGKRLSHELFVVWFCRQRQKQVWLKSCSR